MSADTARYVGLARVKNEADIIESFVRHHLRLLDRLVVVDNASGDGTREILAALDAEFPALTVLDDTTFVYRQAAITTYLARATFARFDCERLFLLDADEFVDVPDRAALDAAIALVPRDAHAYLPWRTHVATPNDDADVPDVLERMTRRREREEFVDHKLVLSDAFRRDPSIVIAQGAHLLTDTVDVRQYMTLPGVGLAHFPLRSVRQMTTKVLVGWNAYIAMGMENAGMAYQWKRLYEAIVRGEDRAQLLYQASAHYPLAGDGAWPALVDAPLAPQPQRYAALRITTPAIVVARALEQLGREMAERNGAGAAARPRPEFIDALSLRQ